MDPINSILGIDKRTSYAVNVYCRLRYIATMRTCGGSIPFSSRFDISFYAFFPIFMMTNLTNFNFLSVPAFEKIGCIYREIYY